MKETKNAEERPRVNVIKYIVLLSVRFPIKSRSAHRRTSFETEKELMVRKERAARTVHLERSDYIGRVDASLEAPPKRPFEERRGKEEERESEKDGLLLCLIQR